MKFGNKPKHIFYKKDGKKFGVMFVGYNLFEKVELCLDLITGGTIQQEPDELTEEKN